jgi:hypothetical protein
VSEESARSTWLGTSMLHGESPGELMVPRVGRALARHRACGREHRRRPNGRTRGGRPRPRRRR